MKKIYRQGGVLLAACDEQSQGKSIGKERVVLALGETTGHRHTLMGEGVAAAVTNRARSEYEAIGIGIEMAKKTWPNKDGWSGHGCSALEIPAAMLPAPERKTGA